MAAEVLQFGLYGGPAASRDNKTHQATMTQYVQRQKLKDRDVAQVLRLRPAEFGAQGLNLLTDRIEDAHHSQYVSLLADVRVIVRAHVAGTASAQFRSKYRLIATILLHAGKLVPC